MRMQVRFQPELHSFEGLSEAGDLIPRWLMQMAFGKASVPCWLFGGGHNSSAHKPHHRSA